MNLDIPFKLYPMSDERSDDGMFTMYTTADERWVIVRREVGYRLFDMSRDGSGIHDGPSITSAICEIKERLTGRPYHRHNSAQVLTQIQDGARHDALVELMRLSEDVPGGYR